MSFLFLLFFLLCFSFLTVFVFVLLFVYFPSLTISSTSDQVVVVYFEDDEDANGKTRYRSVPVEHVMLDDDHRRPNRGGGAGSGAGGGRKAGQVQ